MKKQAFLSRAVFFLVSAVCLNLAAGSSFGAVSTGDYLGKINAEVAQNLEVQGYEVEEFEKQRGLIEVEAAIDGDSYEIHVDPKTGEIVCIEEDDRSPILSPQRMWLGKCSRLKFVWGRL